MSYSVVQLYHMLKHFYPFINSVSTNSKARTVSLHMMWQFYSLILKYLVRITQKYGHFTWCDYLFAEIKANEWKLLTLIGSLHRLWQYYTHKMHVCSVSTVMWHCLRYKRSKSGSVKRVLNAISRRGIALELWRFFSR